MISLSVPKDKARDNKERLDAEINRLMNCYGNDVLRTSFMFLKDRQKAEDAFQEVFLKVYKNLDSFNGQSSEKTWIISITVNMCKDMLRSSWVKRVLLSDKFKDGVTNPDMDKRIIRQDEKKMLYNAVMSLEAPYREMIILYYYQELDTKEIGKVLKIPEGTVRSRLHRAREVLKKVLGGRLDFA